MTTCLHRRDFIHWKTPVSNPWAFLFFLAAALCSTTLSYAASTSLKGQVSADLSSVTPQIVTLDKAAPPKTRLAPNQALITKQPAYWATFSLAKRPYSGVFFEAKQEKTSTMPAAFWFDHNGDGLIDRKVDLLPASSQNPALAGDAVLKSEIIAWQLPGAPKAEYLTFIEIHQEAQLAPDGLTTVWQAKLYSAAEQKGALSFEGRVFKVSLQDSNSNGRYDDTFDYKSTTRDGLSLTSDRFSCDWSGDSDFNDANEKSPLGRLIVWNHRLATLFVTPTGDRLSVERYKGARGTLQVEPEITEIFLVSAHSLLRIEPLKDELLLPYGEYRLIQWSAKRFFSGKPWLLQAAPRSAPLLNIKQVPFNLKILAPLVATLEANAHHDSVRFSLSLATQKGDVVLRIHENGVTPPVHLRLMDLQGQPWARINLTPHQDGEFATAWQPPFDAPSRLLTRLEFDSGPFACQELPDSELSVPSKIVP